MAKGYWIGRIDVHDLEAYKAYVETATPAVSPAQPAVRSVVVPTFPSGTASPYRIKL